MKQGNVHNRLATNGQFSELQLSVTRGFNKLRNRLTFDAAQALNRDSKIIDKCLEQLLLVDEDTSKEPSFTQGKDLRVGTLSYKDLVSTVLSSGFADDIIIDMVKRISVAKQPETVKLIQLSPREFGLCENPLRIDFINEEFLSVWSNKNLDGYIIGVCSSEDAPQFFIQTDNSSSDETVSFGMLSITGRGGFPFVFTLEKNSSGHYCLGAHWSNPVERIDLDEKITFRLVQID